MSNTTKREPISLKRELIYHPGQATAVWHAVGISQTLSGGTVFSWKLVNLCHIQLAIHGTPYRSKNSSFHKKKRVYIAVPSYRKQKGYSLS